MTSQSADLIFLHNPCSYDQRLRWEEGKRETERDRSKETDKQSKRERETERG